MKPIERRYIDAYADSINGLQKETAAKLRKLLLSLDPTSETLLQEVMEIMNSVCGWSTAIAEEMSCTFYDGIRELQGVKMDYLSEPKETRIPSATYTATAGIMKDGLTDAAVELLVSRCAYETKRAASENIIANSEADPKKPKWARVPAADCKCDFCLMLGSRGFVYRSEANAGGINPDHYHAFCRCEVVCSFDKNNPRVGGYNPLALYGQWQTTVDDTAKARAERNGTTESYERSQIMQSYGDAASKAQARNKKAR